MTLKLRTDFTWAGRAPGRQRLVFDIVPNPDDWIILGRKKGFWNAEVSYNDSKIVYARANSPQPEKDEQQEITLIPMRAGPLLLPSITSSILSATSTPGHSAPAQYDQNAKEDLLCETYLENAAEVIRVLPARKVVRAMIPLVAAAGCTGEYRRDDWGVVV